MLRYNIYLSPGNPDLVRNRDFSALPETSCSRQLVINFIVLSNPVASSRAAHCGARKTPLLIRLSEAHGSFREYEIRVFWMGAAAILSASTAQLQHVYSAQTMATNTKSAVRTCYTSSCEMYQQHMDYLTQTNGILHLSRAKSTALTPSRAAILLTNTQYPVFKNGIPVLKEYSITMQRLTILRAPRHAAVLMPLDLGELGELLDARTVLAGSLTVLLTRSSCSLRSLVL